MHIRHLASLDAHAYRELRLRALVESSASFSDSHEDERALPLDHFERTMGTTGEHFTLGGFVESEALVGIATFKRDARRKARHKSFIHTMYVAPEHRGRGIAAKLLDQVTREARAMQGLEQIHLWVLGPETSAARRLYVKAGFVAQGTVVRNDLFIAGTGYVDAEYMTLTLA